jgi:hypothetical protein
VRNPLIHMAHKRWGPESDWDAVYQMQDGVTPLGEHG